MAIEELDMAEEQQYKADAVNIRAAVWAKPEGFKDHLRGGK